KAANQRVGDEARTDDHDDLREHGEEKGVPERAAEDRVVEYAAEVREADPLAAERAGLRVGEAEVAGEDERPADEHRYQDDRGRDQQRREKPATFRDVPEPLAALSIGRSRTHVASESMCSSPCEVNELRARKVSHRGGHCAGTA